MAATILFSSSDEVEDGEAVGELSSVELGGSVEEAERLSIVEVGSIEELESIEEEDEARVWVEGLEEEEELTGGGFRPMEKTSESQ